MKKYTLAEDFQARKDFYTNRASAIFPLYFKSFENDLIISFLNYWTLKNKIPKDSLILNIRIYKDNGSLYLRKLINKIEYNNIISIRDFVKDEEFEGMLEIEIISIYNLRFPFPAISGVFKSKEYYSSVHSAGRIKGSNELSTSIPTLETNWTCKFFDNITPFFHYFNGLSEKKVSLVINLYSGDGKIVESKVINKKYNSLSSEIFFADELFETSIFKKNMFLGIQCNNDEAFRRMVVGNYHRNIHHLEVTHTFSWQDKIDYCPKTSSPNTPNAFLALYNDKPFSLSGRVFPTNCPGEFNFKTREQHYDNKTLSNMKENIDIDKQLKMGFGQITIPSDIRFQLIELYGKVPSRFNANFIYKCKGIESNFSTDIASGAKSSVYPPKVSHWGSGIIGKGYDFILMIRNNKHDRQSSETTGILTFYGLENKKEFKIELKSESSKAIKLSQLSPEFKNINTGEIKIFTWLLNVQDINCETFWISYRNADGCILGCHGY